MKGTICRYSKNPDYVQVDAYKWKREKGKFSSPEDNTDKAVVELYERGDSEEEFTFTAWHIAYIDFGRTARMMPYNAIVWNA